MDFLNTEIKTKKSQKFSSLSLLLDTERIWITESIFHDVIYFPCGICKKYLFSVSHGNFCRSSLTRFILVCSDLYFKLTQISMFSSNDFTTDLLLVTSFRCCIWGFVNNCGVSPCWQSLQQLSWLRFHKWYCLQTIVQIVGHAYK